MRQYLLGVDIGTSGCKATIIDTSGQFVSDGFNEYSSLHPHPGWSEQLPEFWLNAAQASVATALQRGGVDPAQILGLSFDASAHNAVLLDKDDKPLRPTIMWTDQRAGEEAAWLREHYGKEIFRVAYNMPNPTWTMAQLLWIKRHEPEVFNSIHRIMFLKDYVRYVLTGVWCTEHIEAQGALLFDNKKWTWSKEFCDILGLPMEVLPPIKRPLDIAGHLTEQGAAFIGLKAGTPVLTGSSDTSLELYSVGAIAHGDCVVKMATAGSFSFFSDHPLPDPTLFTYAHVVDGIWYMAAGTNSAALSLRWYRDTFCQKELAEELAGGKNVYRILDDEAAAVAPGAEGLIFNPYLNGERSPYWDPKLRASFIGVRADHTRGHFNRAILEGVAYSIRDNFAAIPSVNPSQVKFLGGGAKSPLWRQILADVLNVPVVKYRLDDSSFGGALVTGVALGVFSSHKQAIEQSNEIASLTQPNPEAAAAYDKYFPVYKAVHDALAPIYHDQY